MEKLTVAFFHSITNFELNMVLTAVLERVKVKGTSGF